MDQPLKPATGPEAQNLDSGTASDEPAGGYRIKLEIFEGPLDLLLFLIKKEEVSILDIPIARITDQYLDYIAAMQELDIGVAGEFLLMAATLIQIKSQMLLPRDPTVPEEAQEDPRKDLVQQLIEHQRFKAAADLLYQRRVIEGEAFSRASIESDDNNPEIAATIFKLFDVFREILARQQALAQIEIARDETTLAEKIFQIKTLVRSGKSVRAIELFEKARTRRELVLTFLAILELVKELAIRVVQEQVFGDIVLTEREDAPADFAVDRESENENEEPESGLQSLENENQEPGNEINETEAASEEPGAGVEGAEDQIPE